MHTHSSGGGGRPRVAFQRSCTWAQCCLFFFEAPEIDTYEFTVKHTGGVALHVGEELVASADAAGAFKTSSGTVEIPKGLQKVDVICYKTTEAAEFELSYNATTPSFKHDKATGCLS